MMDDVKGKTPEAQHKDDSSSPRNLGCVEITEELSPRQNQRWRGLEEANRSLTSSPISKRFRFSPMPSPRIGRRVGSMSPSTSRNRTGLKNLLNFKNRIGNVDVEEGVGLVFGGRDKSRIRIAWSSLLTPRRSKNAKSLPGSPMSHSNPESMHGGYRVDPVRSMKRERGDPIRRSRSVPALFDKDVSVKPSGFFRVIPTPSRGDKESLEMIQALQMSQINDENDDGGEDVPEEEAVCRICMVELGEDSEAFKMECMCKGELALTHKECTIKWFSIKGNIICDVCKQEVKNLPVTLLRVQDSQDRSGVARETEASDYRGWQDVPYLVIVSMIMYFLFLEHLLLKELKSSSVAIALPFACVIGLLSSMVSTTMVMRKYVWIFAAIQFSFVVLFAHLFYSVVRFDVKQPVMSIVLATMIGFGVTMTTAMAIREYVKWSTSDSHQTAEPAAPAGSQMVQPPAQTIV